MIRQILVPLDGSALAEMALPCAEELARLTGAAVALARVVGPLDPLVAIPPDLYAGIERARGGAEAHAHAYLAIVARQFERAGVAVRTRVAYGDPAEEIIRAAGEADLVAMSTHGRSGIGRWAYGSVADKVLRGAPVPVLLLRADQTEVIATGHPKCILVPLDGSELAEGALPVATDLARRAGAALLLMRGVTWPHDVGTSFAYLDPSSGADLLAHDEEDARAYLAEVGRRLAQAGLAVTTRLRSGPAAEAILACAAEERAELIAMSTHGRGGLGRWAFGSVADRVLRSAAVPVLLVRAAAPAAVSAGAAAGAAPGARSDAGLTPAGGR